MKPFWLHCLLAFPLGTVPAFALILMGAAVLGFFGIELPPEGPVEIELNSLNVLLVVIVGPLVETFLLAIGVIVLFAITKRAIVAAALSALLWGTLHGLAAPFWFVGATWPFYIFSIGFLAWWPRSFRRGFMAAFIPHALNNGTVIVLLALEELVRTAAA